MNGHVHVFVTVCTDSNRMVTKCACGEPSPTAVTVESRGAKVRMPQMAAPKPAPVRHEALRAGKCNAADPISTLRCRWAPGHAPGRHSWVTT